MEGNGKLWFGTWDWEILDFRIETLEFESVT